MVFLVFLTDFHSIILWSLCSPVECLHSEKSFSAADQVVKVQPILTLSLPLSIVLLAAYWRATSLCQLDRLFIMNGRRGNGAV